MEQIDPMSWKADLPAFREKTEAFYAGELDKAAYKGFSGLYGSYAQKGGKASMLRLRMTAGRVTPENWLSPQTPSANTASSGCILPPARPFSSMICSRRLSAPSWRKL